MNLSLRKQLALILLGFLAFIVGSIYLINTFFLDDFYYLRKQGVLVEAYGYLNRGINENGEILESDLAAYSDLCASNNILYVVTDSDFSRVLCLETDARQIRTMVGRLTGYALGFDQALAPEESNTRIMVRKEQYTIQKRYDNALGVDFLEIWGMTDSGYYFIMRIMLDSILDSVHISNEFIKYESIIGLLLCLLIIGWVSNKVAAPLKELTELSKRMADLDFGVKYTSGGSNEIGQLGEHFNQMSDKLEKAYAQLMTANNELQKDIEEKNRIDEMRREFLSNVSHELKTPIALVQGYAEGLKECVNEDDPESRDFYCDVIMDEAAKMNNLVRKLLTLNQLEAGNERIDLERFDLYPMIQNKIQSVHILAQQKDAEILYEGPSSLPVWGDEFKVEEVLTNYLSNALNHVDGERKILVSAGYSGNKIRIRVFNTGSPIPEKDIGQIWDKFYKVDKARTREYGGSGVGLSIVRAIMDSFHQKYGVQNLEQGVEFWFELEDGSSVRDDLI